MPSQVIWKQYYKRKIIYTFRHIKRYPTETTTGHRVLHRCKNSRFSPSRMILDSWLSYVMLHKRVCHADNADARLCEIHVQVSCPYDNFKTARNLWGWDKRVFTLPVTFWSFPSYPECVISGPTLKQCNHSLLYSLPDRTIQQSNLKWRQQSASMYLINKPHIIIYFKDGALRTGMSYNKKIHTVWLTSSPVVFIDISIPERRKWTLQTMIFNWL